MCDASGVHDDWSTPEQARTLDALRLIHRGHTFCQEMNLDGQNLSQLCQQAHELEQENALLVPKPGTIDVAARQTLARESGDDQQEKDPREGLQVLGHLLAGQASDGANLRACGPAVSHHSFGRLIRLAREIGRHADAGQLQCSARPSDAVKARQEGDLVVGSRHAASKPVLHGICPQLRHAP